MRVAVAITYGFLPLLNSPDDGPVAQAARNPYIQSRFEGTRYGTDALLIAKFLETIGVHTNAHRGQNWSDKEEST